jgi:hypothetical protein
MIALDNVFYVTTKEHYEMLQMERENWKNERRQIEASSLLQRAQPGME